MNLEEVESPAVIIDDKIARNNIVRYQSYCDQHEIRLRPHIKTHKLPLYAKAQLEAGAVGVTCQKISEAEVMADFGVQDILITYNIIGELKLRRLLKLYRRVVRLRVVADNLPTIEGLEATFCNEDKPLEVLVECDTGAGRCGVQSPKEAGILAQQISRRKGLTFGGLMTYPAIDGGENVQRFMVETKDILSQLKLDCPTVSSGGSPNMWSAHDVDVVNEYRIGTYIYNDRSLVARGVCGLDDCALTVLATVVSTPTQHRAIIDAGSKILTTDLFGLEGYGLIAGLPGLTVSSLSEEHGIVTHEQAKPTGLCVGDRLHIVPNHCCVVSNMVDRVYLRHSGDEVTETYVRARGCVV